MLEIHNFADDTTICTNGKDNESVTIKLDEDLSITLNWFRDSYMAANPSNFQVTVLWGREQPKIFPEINGKSFPLRTSLNH